MYLVLLMSAFGAQVYSGVDPSDVTLLGEAIYTAPEFGWAAPISDEAEGRVRVRVLPTAEEAVVAYTEVVASLGRTPPTIAHPAELAVGDGYALVVWREGNVVATVQRPGGGAMVLSELLYEALAPKTAWPPTPTVTFDGRDAEVGGDWQQVAFTAPSRMDPKTFRTLPVAVVPIARQRGRTALEVSQVIVTSWDRYGRGHTLVIPAQPVAAPTSPE